MLATIAKHSGVIVKISGFDEFMQELVKQVLPEFKLGQLVRDIDQLAKERKENIERRSRKTLTAGGLSNWPPAETDMDKREAIYREGLKKFSQSAELAGNFANFLADQRHDYDEAERYYRKALELDPSHAAHTGNFANFWQASATTTTKPSITTARRWSLAPTIPTPQPTSPICVCCAVKAMIWRSCRLPCWRR